MHAGGTAGYGETMDDPVEGQAFATPWAARAFALVMHLRDRGIITAREWTDALAEEVRLSSRARLGGCDTEHDALWVAALERVAVAKGLASAGLVSITAEAWEEVASQDRPFELEITRQEP
jgi:nitrile hydratase accessory protein